MTRAVTTAVVSAVLMAVSAAPGGGEERKHGTLIEEALPPYRIGAGICFEGSGTGQVLDVDDWFRPLRGTRPAETIDGLPSLPTQMRDEPVRRVQLYLKQVKREFDGDDRLYEFKVLVELERAPRPMVGSGDCSYRSRRRVMDKSWTLEPTVTAMRCGIDCDGGGMDLVRVSGTGEIDLSFTETGIRMSGACFGAQFSVGALRRDPQSGEPLGSQPQAPVFRLHRSAGKACRTLAASRD